MGAMKRLAEETRERKNGSKRAASGGGLLGRLNHTEGKSSAETVSWASVPGTLVSWLVEYCSQEGAAVMFGTTRDGGALVLTIFDGGKKHSEYFGSGQDMGAAVWSFCLKLAGEDANNVPDAD